MSDTPRTDRLINDCNAWPFWPIEHARELERELNAANLRIYHITDGFRREQNDIEQTCGKALGYPRFCDDQKAFPGSTDADGVCIGDHVAASIAAELANKYAEAMERIKRLEEAGGNMLEALYTPEPPRCVCHRSFPCDDCVNYSSARDAKQKWQQAKETKP